MIIRCRKCGYPIVFCELDEINQCRKCHTKNYQSKRALLYYEYGWIGVLVAVLLFCQAPILFLYCIATLLAGGPQ